jgi:hypothetical protein
MQPDKDHHCWQASIFAYGVMLGAVRRASKGMLAPLMLHVAADVTIFSILMAI